MDYGKQVSLTDALCAAILGQGDTPTPAEWERIKALAERVREAEDGPVTKCSASIGVWVCPRCGKAHSILTATCSCPPPTRTTNSSGMDTLDIAFLRATGRSL